MALVALVLGAFCLGLSAVPAQVAAATPSFAESAVAARSVAVVSTQVVRGESVDVAIRLESQGNENGVSASVTFDPALLTYVQAATGADAAGATLILNDSQKASGRVGFMLALGFGQSFAAGSRAILAVRFTAAAGSGSTTTAVGFGDTPVPRLVVDPEAGVLTADFVAGTIAIVPPASARVVSLGNVTVAPGSDVNIPITVAAQGNENGFSLSVAYDEALLGNPRWAKGTDMAAGTLVANGKGALVSLAAGQVLSPGARQILVLTLHAATSAPVGGSTPLAFADVPIPRQVVDASANTLTATWVPGTVGFESADTVEITAGPSGAPNPVASGGQASLTVTATDTKSHTLSYAWTASCPALGGNGTFSDSAIRTPTWTAPANATGPTQNCTVSVTVSDSFSHSATGSYSQGVLAKPTNPGRDLDGDGKTDLLWENTAGWVAAWLMNGTIQTQNLLLYNYPVAVGGWHIVGTGDFNADGMTDILWQSDSGYVAAWLMNRTTQMFNQLLYDYPVAVGGWHIAAAGDLDGDGVSDILWQDDKGYVAYWLMGVNASGYAYQKSNALLDPRPVAAGGWAIVGTGDLNGDGMTDLVWQSPDGYVAAWIMNRLTQVYNTLLYNFQVATDGWTVVGTGDMNGDGMMDILWQQRALSPTDTTRGRLATWLMNGTTHAGTVPLTPSQIADPTWKVVGPK